MARPSARGVPLAQLAELAHAAGTDGGPRDPRARAAMLADGATAIGSTGRRSKPDRPPSTPAVSDRLARTHLLYGEWLRREHRRVDAREKLTHRSHDALGHAPRAFAERARRELLATGETVRKRTVERLDELTPQEVQVARLASRWGRTGDIGAQLFLSPRTVEWHLSNVFGKLGISSRKELSAALSDVEESSAAAGSDPGPGVKPGSATGAPASRV